MSFILTEQESKDFINKLSKSISETKIKLHETKGLNILEPRMYKILFNELRQIIDIKDIVELNRISDSCSQICEELGIGYKGQYNPDYSMRSSDSYITDWDNHFISGFVTSKRALSTTLTVLKGLKVGRVYAIYQRYPFVESITRYNEIFSKNPFDIQIVTLNRPCISKDGNFSEKNTTRSPVNGSWYIWFGSDKDTDTSKKKPIIKWAKEEYMEEYFLMDEIGYQVVAPYADGGYKVLRKPIRVTVDKGYVTKT